MKKLVFGIVATVFFSFIGNANEIRLKSTNEIAIIESNKSITEFEKSQRGKTCVSIGVSIGFFSAEIEVCCWRTKNTGSPVYECSYGDGGPVGGGKTAKGYINVETLDKRILADIDNKKLNSIRIEKSKIADLVDFKLSIIDGDYKILKDEFGRYLEVNVLLTK